MGVLEGNSATVYEVSSATTIHYIDELKKISFDDHPSSGQGGDCTIYWKNGLKSSFRIPDSEEAEEFIQIIGAHLKRFKQSTLKQINLLKDIYNVKSTKFDSTFVEHRELLARLWKAVFPERTLESFVGPHWKELGFQGNDPSTDFRML